MIAISATDKKLTASMDLRFGRSPYFLLIDEDTTRFVVNPYSSEENDVAAQVVAMLKEERVTKVITGEIGPKAKVYLDRNKIQIIMLTEEKISLQHVLKRMKRT